MKRIGLGGSVLILFLALLVVFPVQSARAQGVLTVRGSSVEAEAGETVTVEISIENNPGIIALSVGYLCDTEYFTLQGVENRASGLNMVHVVSTIWDTGGVYTKNEVIGLLTVAVAPDTPAGSYEIELVCSDVCDRNFEVPAVNCISAVITVKGEEVPTPEPEPTDSEPPVDTDPEDLPTDSGADVPPQTGESGGEDAPPSAGHEDPEPSGTEESPAPSDAVTDTAPEESKEPDPEVSGDVPQTPSDPGEVQESPIWGRLVIPAAALIVVILLIVLLAKRMKRR